MSLDDKNCLKCGKRLALIQSNNSRMLVCRTCRIYDFLSIDGKSLGVSKMTYSKQSMGI